MSEKERLEIIKKNVVKDRVHVKNLDTKKNYWTYVYTLLEKDFNYLVQKIEELEKQNQQLREIIKTIRRDAIE